MAGMQNPIGEQPMATDQHMYASKFTTQIDQGARSGLTHFSCSMSAESAATCKILTEDVSIPLVDRRSNMVEFGYERMFEPIHEHLGKHHREHRLQIEGSF